MRVVLTAAAAEDLAAIYAYYTGQFGAAADHIIGVIKAINGLAQFPLMGRPGEVPETRERIVTRYPYRIIYHLDEANQVIEVWRIVHSPHQWPPMDTA